jgi:lysophospholipase L1-like esterase
MGDSITQGTVPGGYRKPLYALLTGNGHTVDFVGVKTQKGDTCPDPNHWGQGGWQISKTPVTVDGRSYVSIQGENRPGLYEEMPRAISTTYFSTDTSSTRNILLLQIGINDILHQVVDSEHGSFKSDTGNDGRGEGQEWVAEGCITRLKALLRLINSTAAANELQLEVILGTLCPLTTKWDGDPVSDVLIDAAMKYNTFISTEIPTMTFTNLGVRIADHHTATVGKLSDGLHPNQEGYEAMARAWYGALTASAR